MYGHVVHCQSAAEVWIVLEQLFSTKSKARALQLRLSLQTLKKENSSIADYVLKMKSLATSLIAAGQQMSDDELILYILGGLGLEFESLNTTICWGPFPWWLVFHNWRQSLMP